MTESTIISKV